MEGFGINTNILETNIINLSVVLVVLFVLGKDVLSSTLEERKRKIVQSIEDVEARFQDAQEKYAIAEANLETAKTKAIEVKEQSKVTAEQTTVNAAKRAETEKARLVSTKESTLDVEKQKLVGEIRTTLVTSAFAKALDIVKTKRSGIESQTMLLNLLFNEHLGGSLPTDPKTIAKSAAAAE